MVRSYVKNLFLDNDSEYTHQTANPGQFGDYFYRNLYQDY
jgi:hypothetical protein